MKKIKILICDDSKLVLLKLGKILEELEISDYDVEVIKASNGQEGVDLYKEDRPDIMFIDIVMPVKSGVEAVKEIIEFDSEAKIVMATSVGTKDNLQKALQNGASDFIQKPLDSKKVRKIIMKLINE